MMLRLSHCYYLKMFVSRFCSRIGVGTSSSVCRFNATTLTTSNFQSVPKKIRFSSSRSLVLSAGFSAVSQPAADNSNEKDASSLKYKLLRTKLEEMDFFSEDIVTGQQNHLVCPMCRGGSSEEKSLSLLIDNEWNCATWNCFRAKCGWSGCIKPFDGPKNTLARSNHSKHIPKRELTLECLQLEDIAPEIIGYFSERMISLETLRRNRVMQRVLDDKIVVAFTYWRDNDLISCKYMDSKEFSWQEEETESIFYGLDDVRDAKDIIIVEGEMDKLSMEEAGFRNCVSVPEYATASVSGMDLPLEEQVTKHQYIWNCRNYLVHASRIIIATKGNPSGQALAKEIARRVGKEKCWRVKWPKKSQTEHFIDANDVLMYMGPEALKEAVASAEMYPIYGLFYFKSYFDDIDAYFHRRNEYDLGVSTGWKSLNPLYNVVPGELTIITGVPNSGKSEWIDALMCNLNSNFGWKFALCSMENSVKDHARKLLEKYIKKPFFDVRYGESVDRISLQEFDLGKQWLDDTFHLIRYEGDTIPSLTWVLSKAKAAVMRHGVRGLVIDPFNELDHQRFLHMTETEYVSHALTMIKRFAQHNSCHIWLVAHPRQLQSWDGNPPHLYDISGSAHFINKCDNGIVIHRNRDPKKGPLDHVQVCVRKVRNKVTGTIGEAFLSYNRITGEFSDVDIQNNTWVR